MNKNNNKILQGAEKGNFIQSQSRMAIQTFLLKALMYDRENIEEKCKSLDEFQNIDLIKSDMVILSNDLLEEYNIRIDHEQNFFYLLIREHVKEFGISTLTKLQRDIFVFVEEDETQTSRKKQ
jgi:hypothetical protein